MDQNLDLCVKLDPSAFVADPELIEALEKRSTPVTCDEDRVLFHQGEEPNGLYILHQGDVSLTMASPTGEIVLCMLPYAGSLLGLPALIGNEPYSLTAKASKGCDLGLVTREAFLDLVKSEPMMPLKILHVLAAEVRSARQAFL
jgi:CRP-like cAMP-binding protein